MPCDTIPRPRCWQCGDETTGFETPVPCEAPFTCSVCGRETPCEKGGTIGGADVCDECFAGVTGKEEK